MENRKNNQAEIVRGLIAAHNPAACSAAMGYLVRYDGERVLFVDHGAAVPRVESEKRNKAGRCTKAVFRYADGSRLVFTWSENNGARYAVGGAQ